MNCLQFENTLPDYLEGSPTPEQQAHLDSCSGCSNLLADLNLIASEAGSLSEFDEPSPRVWNALEQQLLKEGLIRLPVRRPLLPSFVLRWRTGWLVPAAAALVMVAGIKLYRPARVGDSQPVARQAVPHTPRSESAISSEDSDILKSVASRPPAQVAAYRNDLEQANAFIRDAQEAVRNNPNDVFSQQMLINAYEQKQMLFRLAFDQSDNSQ
jgi:hypothetical protein